MEAETRLAIILFLGAVLFLLGGEDVVDDSSTADIDNGDDIPLGGDIFLLRMYLGEEDDTLRDFVAKKFAG